MNLSDGFNFQAWRQRLLQFGSLVRVGEDNGVQVLGTSDLEFAFSVFFTVGVNLLSSLDGQFRNVLSSRQFNEFLDIFDFTLKHMLVTIPQE